jgi:hypothetical protein
MERIYMTGRVKAISLLALSAALCALPQAAVADTILFERDLPNAFNGGVPYVNDAGQADTSCQPSYPNCRANVSWLSGFTSGGTYFTVGDDFSFSSPVNVDTITVYEIANNPVTDIPDSLPTNEFSSLSLYVGAQTGTLSLATSSYTFARVGYAPSTDYQGGGGGFFPVYAITFTLPGTLFSPGTLYGFAVDATPNTSNPAYCTTTPGCYGLFLAASNAGLSTQSGVIEQGADGSFIYYGEPSQATQAPSFVGLCNSGDPSCPAWDKSSDLNVTITGAIAATPEPVTFASAALALLAGLAVRLRRRRN